MEQRLSVVTLGVDDLIRSRAFFESGLGWSSTGDYDDVVFFQLPGIALGLYGRDALAEDAGRVVDGRFSGITLAVNVATEADVDDVLSRATAAGATVIQPAHPTAWGGYSGYFADLDDHAWEVAHNPAWIIAADGSLRLR